MSLLRSLCTLSTVPVLSITSREYFVEQLRHHSLIQKRADELFGEDRTRVFRHLVTFLLQPSSKVRCACVLRLPPHH